MYLPKMQKKNSLRENHVPTPPLAIPLSCRWSLWVWNRNLRQVSTERRKTRPRDIVCKAPSPNVVLRRRGGRGGQATPDDGSVSRNELTDFRTECRREQGKEKGSRQGQQGQGGKAKQNGSCRQRKTKRLQSQKKKTSGASKDRAKDRQKEEELHTK